MTRLRLLALALAAVLATGCTVDNSPATMGDDDAGPDISPSPTPTPDPTVPHCSALDPRTVPATVAALPDAGEAPYLAVINSAQRDLRVMIYIMGRGGIIDALKAKAQAGVKVQMILDGVSQKDVNQKYYDELAAAGVQVAWSDPSFSYMHAKTIIADGKLATVSSGNYSLVFSIQRERNFVVTLSDPHDVADLVALFDADWEHRAVDLTCTRLVIAPINARTRLLDLIRSAQRTLDIESMQLADTDVRAAIAERARAGVAVRAVLAPSSWIDANAQAAQFLATLGVTARWMTDPNVHVKALLVDGERAYTGSENFSYTSLNKNREVGVILTEAGGVKVIKDIFERDYAAGTNF